MEVTHLVMESLHGGTYVYVLPSTQLPTTLCVDFHITYAFKGAGIVTCFFLLILVPYYLEKVFTDEICLRSLHTYTASLYFV